MDTRNRRRFLATLSSAGAVALIEAQNSFAQESPPEVTTIRLAKNRGICIAPVYLAEELLRAEGFTDVRYVPSDGGAEQRKAIASGEIDIATNFPPLLIPAIEAGEKVTVIAGLHAGCFELFGNERIHRIADLKDKTVGVQELGGTPYAFVSSMAAYIGLNPTTDIKWVIKPTATLMELFADGRIDAFLGFPPEPQELRARKIGRVIVNSTTDRPWSQYFCCMITGNRDFVRRHPVATKRVLRAMIKATDICASQPARVARRIVDDGFTPRYDYAVQSLKEIPYAKWRDYDPEDTLRFYALRLREAGMIKSAPNKIIADGTDWRFLSELKQELKG
jgi:NitT/TauT family transport system substrate-binding protein